MVFGRGHHLTHYENVRVWLLSDLYDTRAPSKTTAQAANSCAIGPSTFLTDLSCSLRNEHNVREQQTSNRRHFY